MPFVNQVSTVNLLNTHTHTHTHTLLMKTLRVGVLLLECYLEGPLGIGVQFDGNVTSDDLLEEL